MSKKVKTYGPANDKDVPEVEFEVAKLVQNAKSRGLEWCGGAYYKDAAGLSVFYPENAVACCAVGAARLSPDLWYMQLSSAANDMGINAAVFQYDLFANDDRALRGLGYRLAMGVDDA